MLKHAFLIAGLFCGLLTAADDAALLAAGRQFTAQLKLDAEADARLFQAVGLDRAAALLSAVMSRGQEQDATTDDWAAMHRATAGLVELFVQKGELLRASIFAYTQSLHYRNFEHDYEAALGASRQALELQRKSGLTETIDVAWSAVAGNLISLGRLEEAAASLREAREAAKDPFADRAARQWRDLVQVELARRRRPEAAAEMARFLDLARAAPAYFRGQALLAQSDMRM